MRGRIKEDDSSVPLPDGPFAYLHRYREGGQHELVGRTPRDGGEAAIILDGDALAAGHGYFKFGGSETIPRPFNPPKGSGRDRLKRAQRSPNVLSARR